MWYWTGVKGHPMEGMLRLGPALLHLVCFCLAGGVMPSVWSSQEVWDYMRGRVLHRNVEERGTGAGRNDLIKNHGLCPIPFVYQVSSVDQSSHCSASASSQWKCRQERSELPGGNTMFQRRCLPAVLVRTSALNLSKSVSCPWHGLNTFITPHLLHPLH